MKYRVDVVITNRNSFKLRSYKEDYLDRITAYNRREELEDSMAADEFTHWCKVVPVVECECGEEVECHSFTNTCDCGRDYNFNGDLLAPRKFWGEETGEHWSECY